MCFTSCQRRIDKRETDRKIENQRERERKIRKREIEKERNRDNNRKIGNTRVRKIAS